MARNKLTAGRIRDFQCPSDRGQAFLWDTEAPGLALRATPGTDTRAFVFQSRLNGKPLRITIGDVRAWGIEAARAEARRLQTLIDQGVDPRQQKAERIATSEAAKAVAAAAKRTAELAQSPAMAAWDIYLKVRESKWGELTIRDHARVSKVGGEVIKRGRKTTEDGKTQPGALRPLLLLPLAQIDASKVESWLKCEVAKRPAHAALAFRLLRAFLNWCADRPEYADQVQQSACASKAVRDELPKRAAKNDCLQREQLALWFEHVRALPNPTHSAYLQALLLTGARREELASLRWKDVDFKWRSLTIHDKVEGERMIPLTPYVAGLLLDLQSRNERRPLQARKLRQSNDEISSEWKPSPWVFSSPSAASGRLQEPRVGHNKALIAAGLPNLTLHGLRRSFGTLSEWVEVPAGIVAQIMGHKPSAIAEKHYRRRPLDLLRQWHTKIEGWILTEAGIPLPTAERAAPSLTVIVN